MSDDFKILTNENKPQDAIPYEYRMKYIIEDYRKNLERLDKLKAYAKSLELKLKAERERRSLSAYNNRHLSEKNTELSRANKRLSNRVAFLTERIGLIKSMYKTNTPITDDMWPKDEE